METSEHITRFRNQVHLFNMLHSWVLIWHEKLSFLLSSSFMFKDAATVFYTKLNFSLAFVLLLF